MVSDVNRHERHCNRPLKVARILHRYVKDHRDGLLSEQAAAGLLDTDHRTTAIRRESAEELGVTVGEFEHVFDL